MRFRVLGPVTVQRQASPVVLHGPKQEQLLALLLSRANVRVGAETLVDELWGSDPPATAREMVSWHIHQLRKSLGEADRVTRRGHAYLLRVEPGELDADLFERRCGEGLDVAATGDDERAAQLLGEALTLWYGQAYENVHGRTSGALAPTVSWLDELRRSALEAAAALDLRLDRMHQAAARLFGATEAYPYDEGLSRQLMDCLVRLGRRAEALTVYRELRMRLRDDLGLDPEPATEDLLRSVLALGAARIVARAPHPDGAPVRFKPGTRSVQRG